MKRKTHIKQLSVILPLVFGTLFAPLMALTAEAASYDCTVDVGTRTYSCAGSSSAAIPQYLYDTAYTNFVSELNSNSLPKIYFTDFLYDGNAPIVNTSSSVGNRLTVDVININTTGNISFTGAPGENESISLAFNTNNLAADTSLFFDGATIDSRASGMPAIYIYNKDPNYKEHKVSLHFSDYKTNKIEGGAIKKQKITDTSKNLFGAVKDTDGSYYYTAGGAISSDIDLTINGYGHHSGISLLSKKGAGAIECKGDLTFSGLGSFNLYTKNDGVKAYGNLNIVDSSLFVVVDEDVTADAIEAQAVNVSTSSEDIYNTVYAAASPKTGSMNFNTENGVASNGNSAILAAGMSTDKVNGANASNIITLNFTEEQPAQTLITITNTNGKPITAARFYRPFKTMTIATGYMDSYNSYNIWSGGTVTAEIVKTIFFTDLKGEAYESTKFDSYTNIKEWSLDHKMKWAEASGEDNTLFVASSRAFNGVEPSGNTEKNTNGNPSGGDNGGGTTPTNDPEPDPKPRPQPNPNPSGNGNRRYENDDADYGYEDYDDYEYSSNNKNNNSNNSGSGNSNRYITDNDNTTNVPNTSAYTPTPAASASSTATPTATVTRYAYTPNTGLMTNSNDGVKIIPNFAWLISGSSAITLVAYVVVVRKKNAIRFRR